jgi:hypothetical protein
MPRYRHVFLAGPTSEQRFSSPRRGGSSPRLTGRNRDTHAAGLTQQFAAAWQQGEANALADRHGLYLDFLSEPGFDLVIKSLEAMKSGIRLVNVRREGIGVNEVTRATVYVPRNKRALLLNKIIRYATELDTRSQEPKHKALVESISTIRASLLQSFWQDKPELIPGIAAEPVEIWLSTSDLNALAASRAACNDTGIPLAEGQLGFPERTVFFGRATRAQLENLLARSDRIAEFRAGRAVATVITELENKDQAAHVAALLTRIQISNPDAVAVLILDEGANNGHPLLQGILANADRHTVNAAWGGDDHGGHGTRMAGTAAYGDILDLLQRQTPIPITHRLESAKILPPPSAVNPKEFWGLITAQAISRAEIQVPERRRIICLAVTAHDSLPQGRPSAWSGEIDSLASGATDDLHRLFVVSAGNVRTGPEWLQFPVASLAREVEDPAQAWNALTVGAYTNKVQLTDPTMAGYTAIALAGDLSPFSTTSSTWPARKWPIKPEVLFEGGNVARGPNNSVQDHDDLKLISTWRDPAIAHFAPFDKTSAAAAQGAWFMGKIQAAYPDAWPETIRALVIHSAEWTSQMKQRFLANENKSAYAAFIRICGYGVPNLERALYCAANSLTLISQATLQPFDRHQTDSRYVTRDMHLYQLPWPAEVLASLNETPVTMRVTLSYFVEPSPGEVGWQDRYRYSSFGLRFEVNGPGETSAEFIPRVNRLARDDDDHPGTEGPGERWTIGEARNVGSVHSDIWSGRAIDLANSNLLAVYPTVGWWRERHHLGRWDRSARYSLLVSIHLPEQQVDIYTPVSVQVGVAVPVPVSIPVI